MRYDFVSESVLFVPFATTPALAAQSKGREIATLRDGVYSSTYPI